MTTTVPAGTPYQLQVFLAQIHSKIQPSPLFLPALPVLNGEEFLRWLAETAPLYRSTMLSYFVRDDRLGRFRGGSVGWQVHGKLLLPL